MRKCCTCTICLRSKRIRRDLVGGSKQRLRKVIEELHEALENAESDRDYYSAIIDGSWPTAVETLTFALDRAVTIRGK